MRPSAREFAEFNGLLCSVVEKGLPLPPAVDLMAGGGRDLALKELGLEAVPSATNFILFHVGPDASERARALLKRGIIVRDMLAWNLPEYLRVTIGLPEENRALIQALREELKGKGKS